MALEFDDSQHYGFFLSNTTLTSSTGHYVRMSALVLAALRAAGLLDNMEDGTTPPATDKFWLDKNTDPPVLKEWDATGSSWQVMTFKRMFERAAVTPMATPTGTANALVVAAPTPFISNRLYSLTPVANNTGATTIQVTGVGTYDARYPDGSALDADEFRTGYPTILLFTGVRFEVLFKAADFSALVGQAEAAAAVAVAAANGNLVFTTRAAASSATVDAGIHSIFIRGDVSEGDGLGGLFIDSDNGSTDTLTSNGGTRTWYRAPDVTDVRLDPTSNVGTLAADQTFKLAYHKTRGSWHIKAFGTSLTDVGGGNAAVDTAALQSAMASGEIIDVTGTILKVNDTIVCNLESSKIGATIQSHRNAGAVSQIRIDDDELPVLFQVGHDNFEASGFSIRGESTNETTTFFWFERTVDNYRDIDARIVNMSLNFGARAVYHKGRGLEFMGNTISDFHRAGIELDQPDTWTPRGSASIDGPDTGTRGVRLLQNRVHAMQSPFVRNDGLYSQNIAGIEANGIMADIGCDGGLFKGVFIDLQASDVQCRYSAAAGSRIFELEPGSRNVNLTNFNAAGYVGASGNRLANHAVRMTSSLANPIRDIFFNVGTMGPTLQAAVNFLGDGAFDNIVFNSVVFQGIGQDGGARSPIQIGSSVTSSMIKLIGTHARDNFTSQPFLSAFNTPANNTLYRELTATRDGSFSGWATAGVVQPPY